MCPLCGIISVEKSSSISFISALGVPHRDTSIAEVSKVLALNGEISRSERALWIPVGGQSAVVLGRL